ncbi:MAG: glycosyltransferase family 39 protein [Anaerolineales bacterium]
MAIVSEKRSSKIIPIVLIMLGILLIVRAYVANRPLWGDETSLIADILSNSFAGLTKPFENEEVAPTGFLFLQKSIALLFGNKDFVFKIIPCAAGITGILFMYKVAKQYLKKGTAYLFALGLFIVSGNLIWYATEAKQYSSDVAVALVLLWIGYKCTEESANSRTFKILAFVGILAQWFSYPAIFILSAIGIGLGLSFLLAKDWKKLFWLGLALVLSIINFAFIYFFFLRSRSSGSYLLSSWQQYFMPMPPWQNPAWFYQMLLLWINNPMGFSNVPLTIILLTVGCVSMFLRKWQLAIYLVFPCFITLLASGFQKYPFANRLLLFTLPLAYILIAEGLERIRLVLHTLPWIKINSQIANTCYLFLAVWLMITPASGAFQEFLHPSRGDDITTSMAYVRDHRLSTDKIYVNYDAVGPFQYYASSYGFKDSDYIGGIESGQNPEKYIEDIQKLRGNPRVWFIFSHFCPYCNEDTFIRKYLYRIGTKLDTLQVSGGVVYLYDLSYHNP